MIQILCPCVSSVDLSFFGASSGGSKDLVLGRAWGTICGTGD